MFKNDRDRSVVRTSGRPVMVWTDADPASAAALIRDNLLDLNAAGLADGVAIPMDDANAIVVDIAIDRQSNPFDAEPLTAAQVPATGSRRDVFADASITPTATTTEILVAAPAEFVERRSRNTQWPAISDAAGVISPASPRRAMPAA